MRTFEERLMSDTTWKEKQGIYYKFGNVAVPGKSIPHNTDIFIKPNFSKNHTKPHKILFVPQKTIL